MALVGACVIVISQCRSWSFPPLPSRRYFTEDVPVLLFTSLPMIAIGVWFAPGGWWKRAPFLLAVWELILHSCLSHKEHRYVLPIVPVASVYAGMS